MGIKIENPSYYQTFEVTEIARSGARFVGESDVLRERIVEVLVNDTYALRITCTPNHLRELVLGRLFTEGFIASIDEVESINISENLQRVKVSLKREDKPQWCSLVEEVPTTGGTKGVIRRYALTDKPLIPYEATPWDVQEIFKFFDVFSCDTPLHSRTSGTHSCYLCIDGDIVFLSEDIGRHNALDKVIGYALLNFINLARVTVFTSGRIPVDMVTKALRAKIPVLASKAAPTDQAIKLARKYGLTLICLVEEGRFSVFSGAEREKSVCYCNSEIINNNNYYGDTKRKMKLEVKSSCA